MSDDRSHRVRHGCRAPVSCAHVRHGRRRHRPREAPRDQGARGRRVRGGTPAQRRALAAGEGLDAQRRAHVVAPQLLRPSAAVRLRGPRRALPRRGRQRVRRLQHRRHEHVLRLRAGARRRGTRSPRRDGHPVPAAERGRDLGRRGARPPLRTAEVAVHARRHEREHGGDPHGPRADRPRARPVLRGQVPRPLRRRARRTGTTDGRIVPEEDGLPADVTHRTKLVPFNDPEALRAALEPRDVAVVITEPVRRTTSGYCCPRRASTRSSARSRARPAPCSATTRRTRRWSAPAASRGCGTSNPTS